MSQNSTYIHKSHNVTVLPYHFFSSAKNRKVVITDSEDKVIVEICDDIEKRYGANFLEIGTDKNHVHFLIQSVPSYSITKIVTMIKSIVAREVFKRCPEIKKAIMRRRVLG